MTLVTKRTRSRAQKITANCWLFSTRHYACHDKNEINVLVFVFANDIYNRFHIYLLDKPLCFEVFSYFESDHKFCSLVRMLRLTEWWVLSLQPLWVQKKRIGAVVSHIIIKVTTAQNFFFHLVYKCDPFPNRFSFSGRVSCSAAKF